MTVVVSDTSPLRALQAADQLRLLPDLYGQVLIPPAVAHELAKPVTGLQAITPSTLPWLIVRRPTRPLGDFHGTLGVGESEALALAVETDATVILLDDRAARQEALRRGLAPVGFLGVLLLAKESRFILAIAPFIAMAQEKIGFRVSDQLLAAALKRAGEMPLPP